jgi:hypothetical protein
MEAKEAREKEKDPQVRYERFIRASSSNRSNTAVSGSFGGKPKTTRGKLATGKVNTVAPPAWLKSGANDADT